MLLAERPMNNTNVDSWLADGCGRCERFQTPSCKVHRWPEILRALRALAQGSGLTEAMKWGNPCYTLDGKNVAMIGALNDAAILSFFKGALLQDDQGLLEAPGPNSQAARQLRFTTLEQVQAQRELIQRLLEQAAALERAGARVAFAQGPGVLPGELQALLDADPALVAAFAALTPGRQRSHALHVGGARTPTARASRAQVCAEKIRAGKGFLDR